MVIRLRQWNHYDSELEPPPNNAPANWTLTLRLNVKLVALNRHDTPAHKGIAADLNGRPFRVEDWSTQAWNAFRHRYEYLIQRFWDDRFWLRTPENVVDLDWPRQRPTHRPNVRCRFQFRLVSTNNWHYRVFVYRVGRALFERDARREFRSSSRLYDNRDVVSSGGQLTVAHEVGHLLLLPHEGVAVNDPTCMAASSHNAQSCYAPDDSPQSYNWGMSIMGSGMMLFPHHARPWIRRISSTSYGHGLPLSSLWEGFLQHHDGADRPRLLSELPANDFAYAVVQPPRPAVI